MDLGTTLTRIRKAATTPGGRAAIRTLATAASLAGRFGHPVLAAAVVISADYLTSLSDDTSAEEDGR